MNLKYKLIGILLAIGILAGVGGCIGQLGYVIVTKASEKHEFQSLGGDYVK